MTLSRPLLAACLVLAVTGARVQAQGVSMPRSAASDSTATGLPVVDAEVRKVDLSRGMVILKHGDIPNLGMPGMTMGFDVVDKKMLEGLKVGQKVRFQADMVGGRATVTELRRVP